MLTLRITLAFLILSVVCPLNISDKQTVIGAVPDNEVINVYLIPHSHDDVGWLKNPNDYFFGGSQDIQWAGVQYTLDNVITEISVHDSLKFSVVEIAFLDMWWRSANQTMKNLMTEQVKNGRIQFLNAGWCMSDQAAVYYEDSIDQMTLGLQWVKERFDVIPNVAWQIDPFGHQASFANLGHQMGFNAMFFARIHYQDKIVRSSRKALELLWNPPQSSGNQNPIFTHVNFLMYTPPSGFCFDKTCTDEPIKTDPTMDGHNLAVKSQAFVEYFKNMSKFYQSNNLMHTLGGDFHWSNARMWTLNIDRLIKEINNKPQYGMNVRYATPGEYLSAIYKQNLTYPEKTDDFFPYADYPQGYWSGYFTSRVSLKGFVRDTGRWLQALRTKLALLLMSNKSSYLNFHLKDSEDAIMAMEKKMGVLQHHDAVSGTSKQKVADWYIQTACIAKSHLTSFYDNIIKEQAGYIIGEGSEEIFQTHWNSTSSQWGIFRALSTGKKVLVHLYNPGPRGVYPIKMKLDSRNLNIIGTDNKPIKGDLICGNNKDSSDCQLFFELEIPETSWAYVKLESLSTQGSVNIIALKQLSIINASKQIKLSSTTSLKIHRRQQKFELTLPSGTFPFELTYSHYIGFSDVGQKSGAYIFRPSASTINTPKKYSTLKSLHYAEGDQMVVVALQGDNTYTKLYFNKREGYLESLGVEIETFVDSINVSDKEGKEIVLQITTNLNNNRTFYTDSNGLEEQKRVLDSMPTWELVVTQPVAANYYPINSHIKIKDSNRTVSVLVDRARGGSVIKNGIIELMIHRRLLEDDVRGVWEPLNETESGGKGLTQKVRNYLIIGLNNRQLQKRLDQAVQITWSNSPSSSFSKYSPEQPVLSVPKQTKLWLRHSRDGSYLLRVQLLDNLLTNTSTVKIAGDWLLSQSTLGGNQLLSEWTQKQYKWKGQKCSVSNTTTSQKHSKNVTRRLMKKGSVGTDSQIELKALQIRTFRLSRT